MNEWMLEHICGADLFSDIFETVGENLFSATGKYAEVLNLVKIIHNSAIKPVALMLMFIYFMVAIVDKLSSENFTWEQLWRQMAMLLVAKILIDDGFTIMQTLFEVGLDLANDIKNFASIGIEQSELDYEKIIEDFKDSVGLDGFFTSWLGDLMLFVFLLVPYVLSWVMKLCVSLICVTRLIEIYARATWAPIALSDFFHSGLQGTGWRFLKNFLAVCLQGGMIIIVAAIYSRLFAVIIANITWTSLVGSLTTLIAVYASAIMLLFKSLSLTKEIVGTN